jgi:hypothetical protein
MNDIAWLSLWTQDVCSDCIFVSISSRNGSCYVLSHIALGEDLKGGTA